MQILCEEKIYTFDRVSFSILMWEFKVLLIYVPRQKSYRPNLSRYDLFAQQFLRQLDFIKYTYTQNKKNHFHLQTFFLFVLVLNFSCARTG